MRNKWFPYQVARYLTFEEHRAIKRGETEVARDYSYAIIDMAAAGQAQPRGAKGSVEAAWQQYLGGDSVAAAARRQTEAPAPEVKAIEVCKVRSTKENLY
jgi:hypothetical protein